MAVTWRASFDVSADHSMCGRSVRMVIERVINVTVGCGSGGAAGLWLFSLFLKRVAERVGAALDHRTLVA
ncbi:hypothetical protein ABZ840_32790 [Streptomyces sp. NPDC047117]|uniref:hypothetical protein n=1 Tax=Streptomyces sp. NPDC047117 TaxID=3155379 RepID=UPI00340A6A5F